MNIRYPASTPRICTRNFLGVNDLHECTLHHLHETEWVVWSKQGFQGLGFCLQGLWNKHSNMFFWCNACCACLCGFAALLDKDRLSRPELGICVTLLAFFSSSLSLVPQSKECHLMYRVKQLPELMGASPTLMVVALRITHRPKN